MGLATISFRRYFQPCHSHPRCLQGRSNSRRRFQPDSVPGYIFRNGGFVMINRNYVFTDKSELSLVVEALTRLEVVVCVNEEKVVVGRVAFDQREGKVGVLRDQ